MIEPRVGYVHEEWQIQHLEGVIRTLHFPIHESAHRRARSGSKTHDFTSLGLYLSWRGYTGIFFAAHISQTGQPKKYLDQLLRRTFLRYCYDSKDKTKTKITFKDSGSFEIVNLTEDTGRSPRADFVMYDEEARADPDAYKASESILEGSELALMIHLSTPEKGSKFEENWLTLEKREQEYQEKYHDPTIQLCFTRKWFEIERLAAHPERYEAKKLSQPGWYFRQENECSFESPAGACFSNIVPDPYPDTVKEIAKSYLFAIDWNPKLGHYLVGGRWSDDGRDLYITHYINLFNVPGLANDGRGFAVHFTLNMFKYIMRVVGSGGFLCIERGGKNSGFVDVFIEFMVATFGKALSNVTTEVWDPAGKNETEAVTFLLDKVIHIDDRRFHELKIQFDNAHWDENSPQPRVFKDKHHSPHGFDATLHLGSRRMYEAGKGTEVRVVS